MTRMNSNLKSELIKSYKGMKKKDLGFLEEWEHASGKQIVKKPQTIKITE